MILLIDNYDSFTYNLVQALGSLGAEVETVRNDAVTPEEVEARAPERIVLSPGPCTPRESGVSNRVVRRLAGRIPILGVCLGHQSIGQATGGTIVRAKRLMHGKTGSSKMAEIRAIQTDYNGKYEKLAEPYYTEINEAAIQLAEEKRYDDALRKINTFPQPLRLSRAWVNLEKLKQDIERRRKDAPPKKK